MTGDFTPIMQFVMYTRTNLLSAIEAHLIERRISATKLCNLAKVDHHVISKLRSGGSISLKTIERIEQTIKPAAAANNEADAHV